MTTASKPKLKTSAMIASFVDEGQKTTSAPFGHALVKAARENDKIVGLSADLAKYTDMHIFAQEFPDRFFQMGMAEQLLLGAAAGMAETGLVPFASTYSVFAARRAYDFLCLDIAEPNLNVNIIGGLPRTDHRLRAQPSGHRGHGHLPGHPQPHHRRPVRLDRHRTGRPAARRLRRSHLPAAAAGGRSRPCSTSTTTRSNSARPRCSAAATTSCSSPVA